VILILGAGPAGLTAALELTRLGQQCLVLERDSIPGGLSRTVEYKGYLFDIGGHRFYTSAPLVRKIWEETLGEDFLTRPRLSRIFYRGKFFSYPLEPLNVIGNLGPVEVLKCAASYLRAHWSPVRPENNFETWVSNRFGRRLFDTFFRSYTEKVWGIPCSRISAEWAAQRIRDLTFTSVVRDALGASGRKELRSLIKTFHYPRRGPGMMWNRMAERLTCAGCEVLYNHPVEKIYWEPGRMVGVRAGGREFPARAVLNTLAVRDWVALLSPAAPPPLQSAAAGLNYRDFVTVALMIRRRDLFPDNWIYVHDPAVKVGRIQNYTNWSPEMSPDPEVSCIGLEYFCFEGDGLWASSDEDLLRLARRELSYLGLVGDAPVLDGTVVRVRKAYPVYDGSHGERLATVREWLKSVPNLQLAGRNGTHRYDNQDHAMLSGIMAARNLLGGSYDLWRTSDDGHYLEENSDELEAQWAEAQPFKPLVPGTVD
jgi:protoporphyrinogen oxidase